MIEGNAREHADGIVITQDRSARRLRYAQDMVLLHSNSCTQKRRRARSDADGMYGTQARTWPPLTGCSVASLLHAAATMPRAGCFVSVLDAMVLV